MPNTVESEPLDASEDLCSNCNEHMLGQFCSHCGEKRVGRDKLTLKHFIGSSVRELTDIEHSKIWKTFYTLVLRPGFLTTEYFAGRKSRYLMPLKLCLIIFAASLFLYSIYKPVAVYNLETFIESDQTGTWVSMINELAEKKQIPQNVLIEKINDKWQV